MKFAVAAALARLDVREGLDGIERGTGELERLADGGVDVRNPPAALAVAHDKLLTARTLRHAGLPHPHTTLISPALPAAVPELPLVAGGRVVDAACRIARASGGRMPCSVRRSSPSSLRRWRGSSRLLWRGPRGRISSASTSCRRRTASFVLELNGAVDFRPAYAPLRDVFSDAVAAVLRDTVGRREVAAASV